MTVLNSQQPYIKIWLTFLNKFEVNAFITNKLKVMWHKTHRLKYISQYKYESVIPEFLRYLSDFIKLEMNIIPLGKPNYASEFSLSVMVCIWTLALQDLVKRFWDWIC
jgi:hypothetical protein